MQSFADFLGCLLGLFIIGLAIAFIIVIIKLFIMALPVIIGFGAVIFIIYVFIVGLCHLGDSSNKKK